VDNSSAEDGRLLAALTRRILDHGELAVGEVEGEAAARHVAEGVAGNPQGAPRAVVSRPPPGK
jgi:hypothetical protein